MSRKVNRKDKKPSWDAPHFRARLARKNWTLQMLFDRLVSEGYEIPTYGYVARTWRADGGKGPTCSAVRRRINQLLR